MCTLSDRDIRREVAQGRLKIEPFDEKQLRSNHYDLTLSTHVLRPDRDRLMPIPVDKPEEAPWLVRDFSHTLTVFPGQFLLASTNERVTLPGDLMGVLMGRSTLGRLGLIVHHTAGHVDAGFSGYLTLEMSCNSPWGVEIPVGFSIASIVFTRLESPAVKPYYKQVDAKYQNSPEVPVAPRSMR